eukprot:snap_masked-scaffold_10-processed-gene-1.40-mRNA-1 protein AED:1.00 eAED:1.00 QI:0/0/0/0/1/1/4/0/151
MASRIIKTHTWKGFKVISPESFVYENGVVGDLVRKYFKLREILSLMVIKRLSCIGKKEDDEKILKPVKNKEEKNWNAFRFKKLIKYATFHKDVLKEDVVDSLFKDVEKSFLFLPEEAEKKKGNLEGNIKNNCFCLKNDDCLNPSITSVGDA